MITELYAEKPGYCRLSCEDCGQERQVRRTTSVENNAEHPCRSCSNKRNGLFKRGKYSAWNSGRRYSIRETERTKYVNSHGYVEVWCGRGEGSRGRKDGYRLEHHLVTEDVIGRPLESGEVVHHINGDKTDNSPSNLYLCTTSADHRHIHKQLESLSMDLVKKGVLGFKDGRYFVK
jgi:hypothetical protein